MESQITSSQTSARVDDLSLSLCELLAVSFVYPPAASPRAVQVARLLKHLEARTTLVCADYDQKDRIDPTLVADAEAPLSQCIRVPFARSWMRTQVGRVGYRFNLPLIDKIPDPFSPWRPAVLETLEKSLSRNRPFDVLATFGSPMSDHLIGIELKQRLGLPWVAHFSDPWADNPFLGYDSLTRSWNRALEQRVFKAADLLVFTSTETIKLVLGKHSEDFSRKARVLPHAYDPQPFAGPIERDESSLVIRFLGDFYGNRSPLPLFEALKQMLRTEPEVLVGVRFELVGSKAEGQLETAGIATLPDSLVVSRPSVKYLESLQLMSAADGLLVIDAPAKLSVFLPSKLIDYIGAARPIMGITPPGTAASLIRELGGWVADPSDVAQTAAVLKDFICFLRQERARGTTNWGSAEVRCQFEPSAVAEKFGQMLLEMM